MTRRRILCMLLALGLAGPSARAAAEEIKIGLAGPMTGDYAEFGAQIKQGAERAVADINAAGGVLGKQLKLVIGDDKCDPNRVDRVAEAMVSDGAVFVDGHFCSQASIPAARIYHKAGILQITPSSSNPQLTDMAGRKTLFRTCNRDDQQGYYAGKWLAEHYKGKNVAIVHDRTPFGRLVAGMAKSVTTAAGLQTLQLSVDEDESDYSDLVEKLAAAKIDALYFGGYHRDAARIVKQMRGAGLTAAMFGADSLQTEEFAKLAGDAADGVMFTANPDARKVPAAQQAAEAIRRGGFEPEGYTLLSYAAIQVWALAANKAGTTDAGAVAAALRSQAWDTVIGPLSFDAKGDPVPQTFTWLVFKNGKYGEAGM